MGIVRIDLSMNRKTLIYLTIISILIFLLIVAFFYRGDIISINHYNNCTVEPLWSRYYG